MAINITVKNTFLDYKLQAAPARRSTSVPRTWKPEVFISDSSSNCGDSRHSDEVTRASDHHEACATILTETDYQDWLDFGSDCSESAHDYQDSASPWADICEECLPKVPAYSTFPGEYAEGSAGINDVTPESNQGKVTLSLLEAVSSAPVRSKLRSQAQLFKPVNKLPDEMMAVLASMVRALKEHQDIVDVRVHDAGMGGRTMVVAESHSAEPDASMAFAIARDALLDAAEKSENTYVMGYGAEPFQKLDTLSFSTKLACAPAANQESVCWDTYEKGFCPHSGSCIWDHPSEPDMMRIIVMMKKGAASPTNEATTDPKSRLLSLATSA